MSRLAPHSMTGPFRRITAWQTRRRFDRDLEPMGVMAHHGPTLRGVVAMELMNERSKGVEPEIKMLAETKVALVVGCEFCIDIASFKTRAEGVPDDKLLALPHHREASVFDDRERAVLDYAEAVTATPAAVTDEIFAAVREHFDDAQIVELTNAIAWENWRARFNWAFDIGAAGFSEGQACPVPAARHPVA